LTLEGSQHHLMLTSFYSELLNSRYRKMPLKRLMAQTEKCGIVSDLIQPESANKLAHNWKFFISFSCSQKLQ